MAKTIATVYGIKRSKGVMRDTGKEYDSTTLFVGFGFDANNEDTRGIVTQPMKWGTSANFNVFNGIDLPVKCELDIEAISDGKVIKQQLVGCVPLTGKTVAPQTVK